MSTRITIRQTKPIFPIVFLIEGRHFQLHQMGKWWELIEYQDNHEYPTVGRWTARKDIDTMLAEAFALVMKTVRGTQQ